MAKAPAKTSPPEADQPPPDKFEQREIDRALERVKTRRRRFYSLGSPRMGHNDQQGYEARALDAFGTRSPDFTNQMLVRLQDTVRAHGESDVNEMEMNAAVAFVDGFEPENEVQAMSAVVAYCLNDLALTMIKRTKQASTPLALEAVGALAIKTARAAVAANEALAKLKRGGEQSVEVRHVHIYEGGQAVIGNVNHGGGGAQNGLLQSHGPDGAFAGFTPLLGLDAAGDVVPVASDAERSVSHTRRRQSGRADRKP